MEQETAPNDRGRRPDLSSQVSIAITFVPSERGRWLREICAGLARARRSLSMVGALAAATLAAAGLLHSSGTNAVTGAAAAKQRAAERAVAAAFGYPQRCLRIAISTADPGYATAHVKRRGPCAGYPDSANASFHHVDGVWRLVLAGRPLGVPNGLLTPVWADSPLTGAVSGYPLGCLSVEITLHDSRFARADFDRSLACVRDSR